MELLNMLLLIVLSFTNVYSTIDYDAYDLCDNYFEKCEADCASAQNANTESCELCCDLVDEQCFDNLEIAQNFASKFNLCIDENHIFYEKSTRFSNQTLFKRKDFSNYPQNNKKFIFEHGSFSLAHNVKILEAIDYLDCSNIIHENNSHFLSPKSFIFLDYNQITKSIKVGSILVMDRESWLHSNTLSDECRLVPAVKVVDLAIITNNKTLKLYVITPIFREYFNYLNINMSDQPLHHLPQKQKQKQKQAKKPPNNIYMYASDTFNYSKIVESFDCYLVIDHQYAVKKFPPALCEEVIPLRQYLIDHNYRNLYMFRNSANSNSNSTQNRRDLGTIIDKIKDEGKGALEWTKKQSDKLQQQVKGSLPYVESISGDVYEVVTEVGDVLQDVAITFGDAVFAGLMEIIEYLDNFFDENGITMTIPIGIWIDPIEYTEWNFVAVSSQTQYPAFPKDPIVTFTADGEVTIRTLTMAKLGGAINVEARFSLTPITFDYFKFTLSAGLGFETHTQFMFQAGINVDMEIINVEHPFLFFIYILPVQITTFVAVNAGIDIRSAKYVFEFHTGLGELSYEFGFDYNRNTRNKIRLYEDSINTISAPTLDVDFYVTGGMQCFQANIDPYLTFRAGLTFYQAIEASFDMVFTMPILLTYPDTCNSDDECSQPGGNGKLKVAPDGDLTVEFWLTAGITDDIKNVLVLMGMPSDAYAVFDVAIEIVPPQTLAGVDTSGSCTKFNFAQIFEACCPGVTAKDSIDYVAKPETPVVVNPATNMDETFVAGMEYPLENEVFYIKSVSRSKYLAARTNGGIKPFVLENDKDAGNSWWMFEYFDGELNTYKIENYLADFQVLNIAQTGFLDSGFSAAFPTEISRLKFKLTHIGYTAVDDVEPVPLPIFKIKSKHSSKHVSAKSNPPVDLVSSVGDEERWILYKVDKFSGQPVPYMDYYLRLPDYNSANDYLSSDASGTDISLVNKDKTTGRQRWMIERVSLQRFRILVPRGVNSNRFFLKVNSGNSDGRVSVGAGSGPSDKSDIWKLEKDVSSGYFRIKTVIKNHNTYSDSNWYLQAKNTGGDTVRIEEGAGSAGKTLWHFTLVPFYIDYPVGDESKEYYIQAYDTVNKKYLHSDEYGDIKVKTPSSGNNPGDSYTFRFRLCECNNLQKNSLYHIIFDGPLQNGNDDMLKAKSDGSKINLHKGAGNNGLTKFKLKRIGYTSGDNPIFNLMVEEDFDDGGIKYVHREANSCGNGNCDVSFKDPADVVDHDLQKWIIREVGSNEGAQQVGLEIMPVIEQIQKAATAQTQSPLLYFNYFMIAILILLLLLVGFGLLGYYVYKQNNVKATYQKVNQIIEDSENSESPLKSIK